MKRSLRMFLVSPFTALMGLLLFCYGGNVCADTLTVEPEQLELTQSRPVTYLQFHSSSTTETTLNFKVVEWQQNGVRESFQPSSRVIVIPDRITLKPGQSRRVRVGLRLSGPWWEEEAFRVMVTERSAMPDVGVVTDRSEKLVTRPSSVPVFLLPPGKLDPRVSWTLNRNVEGAVVLSASNVGNVHVRLNSASLLGPAGGSMHTPEMSDVLLPGGSRSWEFPSQAAAGLWHLTADTNTGPMRAILELEPHDAPATALSFNQ